MDGGADDPDEPSGGPVWSGAAAELLGIFGPVSGPDLGDELGELVDDPPWCPVGPGDAAGLLAGFRAAEELAGELRAALVMAGLSAGEFADLRGSLDGAGRPVVRLGTVSFATGARLVRVLRVSPNPPAGRGKAA